MTDQSLSPKWKRWKSLAAYAAAVLLTLLSLIWTLKLWHADLRVPLTYYGEANFNALLVKGTLDFGWHTLNPGMAAPDALDLRDVPMSDNNLHFVLIKLIGLFTHDYGLALNLFYLLTFPLTTVCALGALRQFGISWRTSVFASVLYSLLPYHFVRGQHHLFLAAYFLVPLAVMVILWMVTGRLSLVDETTRRLRLNWREPKLIASILICLLVSMSGTYYAFFTCFFLLVAGCAVALQRRNHLQLLLPATLIGIIFAGLMLSLLPSILYLRQHGQTPIVRRHAIDAEIYSLRLSQLLLPVSGHRLFLFSKLKAAFNQRLFINENDDATLGVAGIVGFLFLFGWLLTRKPEISKLATDGTGGLLSHLSILNLAAVLLASFGSIGALVALILTAKIRAYNRISIFIAFFSLLALAWLLDQFAQKFVRTNMLRIGFNCGLAVVLALGVLDQTAERFIPDYPKVKAEFDSDQKFMRQLQASLPGGAMVFQLPFVPFPETPKVGRMFDYDHARGYLHTQGLRWSYGAMKGRDGEAWQKLLASKPTAEMIEGVALSGFQGLYLNRNGYNEAKVEGELESLLGKPQLTSEDGKLIFYDLRSFESQLRGKYGDQFEAKREEALHPLLLVWAEGCSELEGRPENSFRWCSSIGELEITNRSSRPKQVKLETDFSTENDATLQISGDLLTEELKTGHKPMPFTKTFTIPPGKYSIQFRSDARRVLAPGDFRYLVFKMTNFKMTVEN
jgi:phosphoglycerol transferase